MKSAVGVPKNMAASAETLQRGSMARKLITCPLLLWRFSPSDFQGEAFYVLHERTNSDRQLHAAYVVLDTTAGKDSETETFPRV